jgi:hypothetical protein
MSKLLVQRTRIENCGECLHYHGGCDSRSAAFRETMCLLAGCRLGVGRGCAPLTIPSWCPLPDLPEQESSAPVQRP